MKTILVPTDFSKCADHAVKFAIKLGKEHNINLIFFHTSFKYMLSTIPGQLYEIVIQNDQKEKLQILKENVSKNYKSIKMIPNLKKVKFVVKQSEDIIEALKSVIEKNKVDLVIMGTKGASGIDRLMFGSNTIKIIDSL